MRRTRWRRRGTLLWVGSLLSRCSFTLHQGYISTDMLGTGTNAAAGAAATLKQERLVKAAHLAGRKLYGRALHAAAALACCAGL